LSNTTSPLNKTLSPAPEQDVVAGPAVERVISLLAAEDVVAGPAERR